MPTRPYIIIVWYSYTQKPSALNRRSTPAPHRLRFLSRSLVLDLSVRLLSTTIATAYHDSKTIITQSVARVFTFWTRIRYYALFLRRTERSCARCVRGPTLTSLWARSPQVVYAEARHRERGKKKKQWHSTTANIGYCLTLETRSYRPTTQVKCEQQ